MAPRVPTACAFRKTAIEAASPTRKTEATEKLPSTDDTASRRRKKHEHRQPFRRIRPLRPPSNQASFGTNCEVGKSSEAKQERRQRVVTKNRRRSARSFAFSCVGPLLRRALKQHKCRYIFNIKRFCHFRRLRPDLYGSARTRCNRLGAASADRRWKATWTLVIVRYKPADD